VLTEEDLRRLLFCVIEQHERQRRNEVPMRAPWTREMIEKICGAIGDTSRPRQSRTRGRSHSTHADKLLSARQVSDRIGWNVRRVQRHAAELGGELVDGRLLFKAAAIDEHLGGVQ
jgi:hypothetical protein